MGKVVFLVLVTIVLLVAGTTALISQSSWFAARGADALFKRYPRTVDFLFAALFGAFFGIVPAAILYAVTQSQWIAFSTAAIVAMVCGICWLRLSPAGEKRRPPVK